MINLTDEEFEAMARDAKRYRVIRAQSDLVASSVGSGFALAHYAKDDADRQALDDRCDKIAAMKEPR
jgi:hypothetical protein